MGSGVERQVIIAARLRVFYGHARDIGIVVDICFSVQVYPLRSHCSEGAVRSPIDGKGIRIFHLSGAIERPGTSIIW